MELEFVNTPLQEPWGSFLGFGAKATNYSEIVRNEDPIILRLPYGNSSKAHDPFPAIAALVASIHSPHPLLFVLADGQNCYDHTTNAAQLRNDFFNYGNWRHLRDFREPGRLNIAVHIRRGDVTRMKERKTGNWRERYVETDWFERMMSELNSKTQSPPPLFHIFSNGVADEFAALSRRFDSRLHLNASDQESLLNMSTADVLIMSPSGFSYLAAILGKGRRIARVPWWHHIPCGPGWTLFEHESV
jgi:hypothetical protein